MASVTLVSATLGQDAEIEPPLGPLYIASALESAGWQIDFRDYQMHPNADAFNSDTFVNFLRRHECVLMISCFVDMLPVVIEASRKIKEQRAATFILLGGPGPSAGANELMTAFPQIDAIVMGEGEDTVKEFADKYAILSSEVPPIAGMIYRSGNALIAGPPRARIETLGHSVRPAYHLLNWTQYTGSRVITTRGCPYHCSFCDVAPLWNRRAVYRELSDTIDEMILLRDRYGRHEIAIVDDTFVLNRNRVRQFCEELINRNVALTWGCFGRINLMSEELIALMAKAGCRSIFYGIDSGSPAILRETAKEIDRDTILPILEISAKYFDTIEASFIWGYPTETLSDFEQTLQLAADASWLAPTVNVQLHMLSPLPSAPVYKNFEFPLLKPAPEDRRWLLLPGLLLDPRAAELCKLVLKYPNIFPGFYTFPSPSLDEKRELMTKIFQAIHRTLGLILVEPSVAVLLDREDQRVERHLLNEAEDDVDRIGVGLGLGLMRRARRRRYRRQVRGSSGKRGASIVRERNDVSEAT